MSTRRFNDNPSVVYLQAVQALQTLLDQEGADHVERAFADAIWEDRYQRYAQQNGEEHIIPESSITPPTWSAGDHTSFWEQGTIVKTVAHDYTFGWKALEALVQQCQQDGLEAELSARKSWHFPGWTILVEIVKSETPEPSTQHPSTITSTEDQHTAYKQGYYQGWKDSLDILQSLITTRRKTYIEADSIAMSYWRNALLRWKRQKNSNPFDPPSLQLHNPEEDEE